MRWLLACLLLCTLTTLTTTTTMAQPAGERERLCIPGRYCRPGELVGEPLISLTPDDARLAKRAAADLAQARKDRDAAQDRVAALERDAAARPAAPAAPCPAPPDRFWGGFRWGSAAGLVAAVVVVVAVGWTAGKLEPFTR